MLEIPRQAKNFTEATGYRVIQELELKNFRGFREVKVTDLRRINVIVGANGSGKTALLEAIWLCAGNSPQMNFPIRIWRGLDAIPAELGRSGAEEFFGDLFFNYETRVPVEIAFRDSRSGSRSLRVYFDKEPIITTSIEKASEPSGEPNWTIEVIKFQWSKDGKVVHTSPVNISGGKIQMSQFPDLYLAAFLAGAGAPAEENAKRYSRLQSQGKHVKLIEALRGVFPMVQSLVVDATGGQLKLAAGLAGLTHTVPLAFISAGINRYLSILLAMATIENGVVLVDEIENGMYFKTLTNLFRTICHYDESERTEQLFITTHSMECMKAMLPTITEDPEDFSLLRMDRHDNESSIEHFSGERIQAALEDDIEFR